MKLAGPSVGQSPCVSVIKTEEKGSDVNLATHLLADAYEGNYDASIVVTNDSELKNPMAHVRNKLGKEVWILYPTGHAGAKRSLHPALKEVTTHQRAIRSGLLGASQFPDTVRDQKGSFTKPTDW
jgi:uncharacterized LabA/DUF88 family protein